MESVTHGAPVDTARNSLSVTEPTKPKPKACSRYALSPRKTPQFGCVVASIQTTHLTATAHTSRTSSYLPRYMHKQTLKKEGRVVSGVSINVDDAFTFVYIQCT